MNLIEPPYPHVSVFDRSSRMRLLLVGRGPGQMLHGVATGTIPADPRPVPGGDLALEADEAQEASPAPWRSGVVTPSLVLTPKGRIVTDLRLLKLAPGPEGTFLLDLPSAGSGPLLAHFTRYLPPRMARPVDLSAASGMLTVVGPEAATLLESALAAAGGSGVPSLAAMTPGEARLRGMPSGFEAPGSEVPPEPGAAFLAVIRNADVVPPAFDVIGTPDELTMLESRLREAGAAAAEASLWHALRIERGTPETGQELDEGILPPEAGLEITHIDHTKGCYTGQEVIVRIRDRGHVNRHLRGLLLGDHPAPVAGTSLWIDGREKEVGEVRSGAWSPRYRQWIALAYLRREVEPGGRVRLGAPGGPEARVRALGSDGWGEDMAS
jgi:tRNA-modifying protein YgfZ